MAKTRGMGLLMLWCEAALEEEFNAWYNTSTFPFASSAPAATWSSTASRKYLTVYDFARADVPQSEPWNRVRDLNPWTHRIRPQLKLDAGSPAVFRRIWPA